MALQGVLALDPADQDTLLNDAIEIAIDAGKVSTSFLQRRMKVGYSRAARIVDLMEKLGIVGPADGAKPREVLVTEWPPAGSAREHSGRERGGFERGGNDRDTFDEDIPDSDEDEEDEVPHQEPTINANIGTEVDDEDSEKDVVL